MTANGKISTYEDINRLPEGYDALMESGIRESLFHSMTWFMNYIQTVTDPNRKVLIYGLELDEPGQKTLPVAVLSMQIQDSIRGSRTLASLSNYYTPLFGPVLDEHRMDSRVALQALVRGICGHPNRWGIVNLHPLDMNSWEFGEIIRSLEDVGMVVQTYFCSGNWYLRVNGRSYRQYYESLPSILRNTVGRKSKKLMKTGDARFDIIVGEEGLEGGIRAYDKIYAESWKVPEPYPRFIPGLIRTCAERGWLRLGVAYVNGEPAASQLWTVCGGKASIFKLAYDERYAGLSVGSILTTRLMEHVIDVDKVEEVDYLTGDDPYKRDWMSDRRERWGIMAFNPRSFQGIRGIFRHVGGRYVKNGIREAGRLFRPGQGTTRSTQQSSGDFAGKITT